MGEWSKKVGEAGENIAGEFLHVIGWNAAQGGVELPCVHGAAHKLSDRERKTHGIDYLYSCRSPLIDGLAQNLLVSVKFSAEPYPKNPTRLFKAHFGDLAHTLECFNNSAAKHACSQTLKGVTKAQDIGVLLWINNDRETSGDVIRQVQIANLSDTLKFDAIYLVDNRRAQFVFDSINYAKHIANGCDVAFFYADTGRNVNPLSKTNYGKMLPVEHINSSVLALRIADRNSNKGDLVLATVESFSEAALKRLMGLAQHLSQSWCSKVIFAFPDFDRLQHGNIVEASRGCFTNSHFAEAVEVHCYDTDFRNPRH